MEKEAFIDLYDKDSNKTGKITDMELSHVAEYAELFVSVFNAEPWNDSWTIETAQIRIENMMRTPTFIGKALYVDNAPSNAFSSALPKPLFCSGVLTQNSSI